MKYLKGKNLIIILDILITLAIVLFAYKYYTNRAINSSGKAIKDKLIVKVENSRGTVIINNEEISKGLLNILKDDRYKKSVGCGFDNKATIMKNDQVFSEFMIAGDGCPTILAYKNVTYRMTSDLYDKLEAELQANKNSMVPRSIERVNPLGYSNDIKKASVSKIKLNSTKEEVLDRFGYPSEIISHEFHEGLEKMSGKKIPYEEWIYDGLKLQILNEKVIMINITSSEYLLSFKVKVGDSIGKLNTLPVKSIQYEYTIDNGFMQFITEDDKIKEIIMFVLIS